jgi:CII-binding regulator of phage lambda lysogenization HflD
MFLFIYVNHKVVRFNVMEDEDILELLIKNLVKIHKDNLLEYEKIKNNIIQQIKILCNTFGYKKMSEKEAEEYMNIFSKLRKKYIEYIKIIDDTHGKITTLEQMGCPAEIDLSDEANTIRATRCYNNKLFL